MVAVQTEILYFDIRIRVLTVFLCVFTVLNGKLRTTVQTAQTHNTLSLDPDWFFILHFNGLYGAFSGT